MCTQRRLWSARASAQSDHNLRCPHEERLGPQLPTVCSAKTLIRLDGCGCPGWSESLLGAHAILLVLLWGSSVRGYFMLYKLTDKVDIDANLEKLFNIYTPATSWWGVLFSCCPSVSPVRDFLVVFQYLEKAMTEFHKIWQTHWYEHL